MTQERQDFERFMRRQNNGDRLERYDDGNYADISIDYAWSGWQARAKQPEWVSVDERLPENSQSVIAAVYDKAYGWLFIHCTYAGQFLECGAQIMINPTHWKPIEPPFVIRPCRKTLPFTAEI